MQIYDLLKTFNLKLSPFDNYLLPLQQIKNKKAMNVTRLLFPAKIHQLREEKQLYQKQIADALSIDTPMYCRIERGERRAKREQIPIIANTLQVDSEELLSLWLADQVNAIISNEKQVAKRVLELANKTIIN